jgi:AcrR family transcriptional regulator
MDPVKQPQPGRVEPRRRERTRATRRRIAGAAYSLFCDRGYTGTTMADIAAAAGVAVQTVYFTYHTKTEVLSSAYELAVLGDEAPLLPQEQSWYRGAVAEPDAAAAVRLIVEGTGEIVRRVAQLDLAVRTAAESDPEAAQFLRRNEQMRFAGYREMIDLLRGKAELRPGLTAERATDLMLLLVGPASYRALVADRGWSHGEWAVRISAMILEQLFGVHDGEA